MNFPDREEHRFYYTNSLSTLAAFRDPRVPLTEDQLLLRKRVLHQVESEPRSFDMISYEHACGACGTTRCIAGWAEFLALGHLSQDTSVSRDVPAIRLLGLTGGEYYRQADGSYGVTRLFYDFEASRAVERLRSITENPHLEEG